MKHFYSALQSLYHTTPKKAILIDSTTHIYTFSKHNVYMQHIQIRLSNPVQIGKIAQIPLRYFIKCDKL